MGVIMSNEAINTPLHLFAATKAVFPDYIEAHYMTWTGEKCPKKTFASELGNGMSVKILIFNSSRRTK